MGGSQDVLVEFLPGCCFKNINAAAPHAHRSKVERARAEINGKLSRQILVSGSLFISSDVPLLCDCVTSDWLSAPPLKRWARKAAVNDSFPLLPVAPYPGQQAANQKL